jgi:hypothetical protein
MKQILPLMAVALLGGCGIVPPVVGIASYALDGISLLASGRTVTDHALSVAANQDCKVFRAVQNLEICTNWGTEPQIAAAREIRTGHDRDVPVARPTEAAVAMTLGPVRSPADRGVAMVLPTEFAHVAQALPGVAQVDPVPQVATALVAPARPIPPLSRANMTALLSAPAPATAPVVSVTADPLSSIAALPTARPASVAKPLVATEVVSGKVLADDEQSRKDALRAAYEGRYLMVLASFKGPEMAGRLATLYKAFGARVVKADVHGEAYFRVVADPANAAKLSPKLPVGEKPWPMPAKHAQPVQIAATLR